MTRDVDPDNRPAEMPAVRTTIVGGRPPGCGKPLGRIPRGIEVLVKKAAVDPAFRRRLLEERAAAAEAIGLQLAPAEESMLRAVPRAQLETIIERTKVGPKLRKVLQGAAAGLMLAALGTGVTGCSEPEYGEPAGIRPDQVPQEAPARPDEPATAPKPTEPSPEAAEPLEEPKPSDPVSRGIRPDRPSATQGVRPDRPPEKEAE